MDPSSDDDLPDGLKQADDILADFQELGGDVDNPATVQATEDYRTQLKIFKNRQKLMTPFM